MFLPTITYLDNPRLDIVFSTLIVDVEKINEKFGSLKEFDQDYQPGGVTNGRIYCIAEMMQPAPQLEKLAFLVLKKKGLVFQRDFVITHERRGSMGRITDELCDPYLFRELPQCEDTPFLRTLVTTNRCYAWHESEVGSEYYSLERAQYLLVNYMQNCEPELMEFIPRAVELTPDKIVYKLLANSEMHSLPYEDLLRPGNTVGAGAGRCFR